MVKVKSIKLNELTKTAEVSLFSDTKSEITNIDTSDILGFPEGYDIDFSSSVITADGDIAFMKSDGTWNWVE